MHTCILPLSKAARAPVQHQKLGSLQGQQASGRQ
jgi:hypothetical protein